MPETKAGTAPRIGWALKGNEGSPRVALCPELANSDGMDQFLE